MSFNGRSGGIINHVPAGPGAIVAELAAKGPMSRQEILSSSGLARATVVQRLTKLFTGGLILETERVVSGRGRPTHLIDINKQFAVTFAADLGEHHFRLAITDLHPRILIEQVVPFDIAADPYATLETMSSLWLEMLGQIGRKEHEVLGACIGLPAPVDFDAGRPAGPSIIRAWEEAPVRDWMTELLGLPAYVENDVNLLTLAETRGSGKNAGHFFYVKAGTGIGSGIVSQGVLYRGYNGVAGDIGHIQFTSHDAPLCRCGKRGCVEARAAGWAIARDLREVGLAAQDANDVLRLLRSGNPDALRLVRKAGLVLGEVIADAVSFLNPEVIAIGGTLAGAGEELLSGIREVVNSRVLPIATRGLEIVAVEHSPHAALIGAAILVTEMELGPGRAEATVERLMRMDGTGEPEILAQSDIASGQALSVVQD